jgi:signal transduction histidine kinase
VTIRHHREQTPHNQQALAEALQDTAAILNSTLDLNEVLDRIMENIGRVVPHEAVNIMLLETDIVCVVKSLGYERWGLKETVDGLKQPIAKMPGLKQMAQSGEPLVVAKIQHGSVAGMWRPNSFHSYLGAPISIDGQVIGFINLNSTEVGFFSDLHAKHLLSFAHHAGLAIRNARLHDEAQERNRQLAALNEITRISASTQDMEHLLKQLADLTVNITSAAQCYVTLWNAREQQTIPAAGSGEYHKHFRKVRLQPSQLTMTKMVIESGEMLIRRGWEELPYTPDMFGQLSTMYDGEALLIAPLKVGSQALGAMILVFGRAHIFKESEIEWVRQAAELTALVMGRAQAYQEMEKQVKERTEKLRVSNKLLRKQIRERRNAELAEREQRTLAEALRDTAASLNSTLNLDEVLDEILANVGRVVPHDSANIMLIEQGTASMARARGYEERGAKEALHAIYFPANSLFEIRQLIEVGEPVIYCDTHERAEWANVPESKWVRSYIGAPIRMDGAVIGFLNLDSATPGFFCPNHMERLIVFTDQAGIAIKNARLYEQARKLAVLEERERLARDLHDAVSQTLWSASLIADVLPTLWERDAEEGKRNLEQLQELTRVARDEMRSLLLDLQPDMLSQMALRDLLAQLIKTLGGRSGIDMQFNSNGSANLPASVQLGFYRIAQEALNNVVKHAHATRADVQLKMWGSEVSLSIADNGRGFDPNQLRAGHLGQRIMQERAQSIGAALSIDTSKQGTEIRVHWKQGGYPQ